MDKRKSLFKCSYQHRRSRRSTPDLLTPYLLGPELILPSLMSIVQTMPVYLISRSCSSLNSASPFVTRSSSFVDSTAPFDLSLAPSNFAPLHTDSGIVEDLSIKLTTQSVFPSWMDWCGPPGPSALYIASVHSDPIIPTSRNPLPGMQRFYQDFRLPNYPLDTFSGRLFNVVSSTTFVTGDIQMELHCAITRLIYIFFIYIWVLICLVRVCYFLSFNFDCNSPFCVQIIWHIWTRVVSFYWPWSQPGQLITPARSFSSSMWSNQRRYTTVKDDRYRVPEYSLIQC